MINWITVALGTGIGGFLGMALMAALVVGRDPEDEIEEVAEAALDLANEYANRLMKLKNRIKEYPYYIPEDDKEYLIDIIDGKDKEWPTTKENIK